MEKFNLARLQAGHTIIGIDLCLFTSSSQPGTNNRVGILEGGQSVKNFQTIINPDLSRAPPSLGRSLGRSDGTGSGIRGFEYS